MQLGSIADSFIGEPQPVHCGPWFCLSSMALPSSRCFEFAGEPTGRLGLERVRCDDVYLDMIALGTFKKPVIETDWTR